MRVREIAAHKRSVGLLCTGIAKPKGRARAKAKGQPMAAGGGEQASPVGVENVRALLTDLRASISQDIMKETLFVGFIHCALACFIVHAKHEADPQREPPLSDYFQPGKGFNPFSVRTAYERYVPMGALLAELAFAEPPIGRLPSSHVEASALLQIDPRNRVEVCRKAVESNPSAEVITSKCLAGGVERNPWVSTESDRWWTPVWIIALVVSLFGGVIDLDPFSERDCNKFRVKARKYYSVKQDGFKVENPWFRKVFANPPGGTTGGKSNMGRALERALEEYAKGNITCCILLLKVSVGYNWFEPVYSLPHVFLRDKPCFVNPARPECTAPTLHGYVVVYIGKDERGFIETFRSYGSIPGVGPSWSATGTL